MCEIDSFLCVGIPGYFLGMFIILVFVIASLLYLNKEHLQKLITDRVQAQASSVQQSPAEVEAALRTLEAQYRALIDQIPAVTYIAPQDGSGVRFCIGSQFETLLGYSQSQGQTDPDLWLKLLHPEDRERILLAGLVPGQPPVPQNFGQQSPLIEYRALARDGRVLWFREGAVEVLDEVNHSFLLHGVMFDITESNLAEGALRDSEYRYYTLAKMLPVGIFRADLTGKCLYVNERYCEMAGLTLVEVLGEVWTQCLHLDDRNRIFWEWQQVVKQKQPFQAEFRFQQGDLTLWMICQAVPEAGKSGEITSYIGALTDISERKQAEEALLKAEEKYRSIFENASEGIFQCSPDGYYICANPALAHIYGYESPSELMAQVRDISRQLYVDPTRRTEFVRLAEECGFVSDFESEIDRADGSKIWISENVRVVRDGEGHLLYYEGTIEDITERKLAEAKLMHDAQHDTLTGLPNRALFTERLAQAIALGKKRLDYLFAVLFIDLDRFKVVNDSLGHLAGDQLLIAFASRLRKSIAHRQLKSPNTGDTVARLGGDEFAILLETIKDVNEATQVAERVHAELAIPFNLNEYQVFTSASIGIVCSGLPASTAANKEFWNSEPTDLLNTDCQLLTQTSQANIQILESRIEQSHIIYDRPEDLLRDADSAMYHAKALGKARHEVFDLSMHARAVALLQLENDLRRAVEREEFRLYYQPIVSLSDGRIRGFEALLRWQHPQRGLLAPGEFIPVAEETRLIVPIGWWMMRSACQQMRQWQQQFPHRSPLTVSVNLSNAQYQQPDLIAKISQILRETALDASSLKLEITESVIMENAESATALLAQLRALGIQLYIDDFGTGYSSLSRLHTFPTDALKIDRAFVSRMADDEGNEAIVQTILIVAGHLGLDVIAEGVETAKQLAQLRALQCEYGQGYFFSKPADEKAITSLIASCPQW